MGNKVRVRYGNKRRGSGPSSPFGGGYRRKSSRRCKGGGGSWMTKSIPPQTLKRRCLSSSGCSNSILKKKSVSSSHKIGFSVGGAKDINSFRDNILKNDRIPQLKSISYEGIFYDYYFQTEENEIGNNMDDNNDDKKENEGESNEELPLFYPSYMYAKSLIPRC